MATASKRQQSRRRLAAVTFLSNISLDGSHRDTKLGSLRGNEERDCLPARRRNHETVGRRRSCSYSLSDQTSQLNQQSGLTQNERDKANWKSGAYKRGHHLINTEDDTCNHGALRPRAESFHSTKGFPQDSLHKQHQVSFLKNQRSNQIKDERIIFVTKKKAPIAVFSSVPYSRSDGKQDYASKRRHASGTRQLSVVVNGSDPYDLLSLMGYERPTDNQEISYSELLTPTSHRGCCNRRCKLAFHNNYHENVEYFHSIAARCSSYEPSVTSPKSPFQLHHQLTAPPALCDPDKQEHENHQFFSCCHQAVHHYHPNLLDDPELIAGKHSTLLAFPSYITSIIDYVKPSDLKKELNEKFKERFPNTELTLSKLRSLKREMCKIARNECSIDYLTIAQAYIYFEKLVLKMMINKQNRKLCAGACLVLSAKLNDVKGNELKHLIERIENVFRVNRKDLHSLEFGVLVALDFSLHLPTWEILPHYQRLMYEA